MKIYSERAKTPAFKLGMSWNPRSEGRENHGRKNVGIYKKSPIILSTLFIIFGILIIASQITPVKKPESKPALDQQISNGQISGIKSAPGIDQNQITDLNPTTTSRQKAKVTRVIDGDTIEIEGGQKIRYIGIDTPEVVDPRKPVECFGQEASGQNHQLVEGKIVSLEKDVSETDKYGRLLRYVFMPAEASAKAGVDQVFVNDYLVRQGFAHSSSYPPDIKYQSQFQEAQREAQENSRGLWDQCSADSQNLSQSTQSQPPISDCPIKGNISSSGEKIYHLPGQYYYDKTVIDTTRGERWFCTEEETIAAGWRKSKR